MLESTLYFYFHGSFDPIASLIFWNPCFSICKINPSKILIIGAGVAGLSAICTATSLGAIVRAFDTRPEVKEQVESLGAQFLTVNLDEDGSSSDGYAKVMSEEFIAAEMALFKEQASDVDIIIKTALIPGKEAPKLITKDMVEVMKPGSIIVDLASQQGGNCELCEKDAIVEHHGVKIIGLIDNMSHFIGDDGKKYQIFGEGGVKKTAEEFKKEFLGEIPINPEIGKSGDSGKPIVEENPNHEISKIYINFANKIKSTYL